MQVAFSWIVSYKGQYSLYPSRNFGQSIWVPDAGKEKREHRFTQSNSDCFDIQKLYENTGDFFKATYIV